jgi:hypothetical protein
LAGGARLLCPICLSKNGLDFLWRRRRGILPARIWASHFMEEIMSKRGKILRDTNAGPGLVIVDGQQHQFTLEGTWKSAVPPRPNMVVDVDFAPDGKVSSIAAVPESQIAKEQAELVMAAARDKSKAVATAAVAKFGLPTLIATGLLIVGWFFLTTVSIKDARLDLTFWQLLGYVNAGGAMQAVMEGRTSPSAGLYGILAIVALAGPFLHYFWKDKRAVLGGLLPLLFMLVIGLIARNEITNVGGADTAGVPAEMLKQMRDQAMQAISMGLGAYLSGLVGIYFAAVSLKSFLVSRASGAPGASGSEKVHQAAA